MSYVSKDELIAAFQRIQAEGGGLINILTVKPEEGPRLLMAAAMGDAEAEVLARCIVQTLAGIRQNQRNRKHPPLCACCPRALLPKVKFAFAVVLPVIADPKQSLVLPVCDRCGKSSDELFAAAQVAVRSIWPNAKPLPPVHHAGGRA
jgi:hypothetical protein